MKVLEIKVLFARWCFLKTHELQVFSPSKSLIFYFTDAAKANVDFLQLLSQTVQVQTGLSNYDSVQPQGAVTLRFYCHKTGLHSKVFPSKYSSSNTLTHGNTERNTLKYVQTFCAVRRTESSLCNSCNSGKCTHERGGWGRQVWVSSSRLHCSTNVILYT